MSRRKPSSSAATSKVCGTVTPSALAVLRLITSSNLVGCWTGRSPGLSPFRIRSTYAADRRVPPFNTDKDKTLASMQRIADIVAKENGQLWINHDKPQTDAQKKPPEFYD
jgi:hypothetical protein